MNRSLLVMLLKDLVILPFQEIKLELKDDISKKIIKLSEKKYSDRILVVAPQNNILNPSIDDLPKIGVIAYIKNKIELSNGNIRITLKGEKRVSIINYESFSNDIIDANYSEITLPKFDVSKEEIIKKKLKELLNEYINSSPNISNSILRTVSESEDLSFITDAITTFLPLKTNKKLEYMQEVNASKRAESLLIDLNKEINYNELDSIIDNNIETRLTKEQQEYYLKEKLKEIESILGINNNSEVLNYYELLNKLNLGEKISNKIVSEIKKLESINNNSPEYSIIKSYLDWIINLPWNKSSKENLNSKNVLASLNKSHYGLNEIKEKIIDYVNLKNINKDINSPIICLVGPPGVGKTTIARSIANSLNREFYKISVGGLNDASELVGNRRTYLGALPGKIIQGLKKCDVNNPVMLIDEIDKMVKDYKGDPASTLLDVLDNTQNKTFVDNYIEEPFDLSNILFILTANNIEDIPYTLLDRLDIIDLSSYTVFEKIDIAKKYLLPKIVDELNISKKITIKDDVLSFIINGYTKEAGVRNLDRILKKLVTKIVTSKKENYNITTVEVIKYLNDPKEDERVKDIDESGVVNALAYTPYGGATLKVECSIYNGEERIITTGRIGEVLEESAIVSISYLKEKGYVSNIEFYNHTIHLHLLDAATKKDGPSCGVAITSAILSKLLNKKVSEKIAFTGEITLKGNILKIGGLKEKLIAAYNSGVKTVYVPLDNNIDLKDIPKQITSNLEIKLVSNYDKIYNDLFNKNNE